MFPQVISSSRAFVETPFGRVTKALLLTLLLATVIAGQQIEVIDNRRVTEMVAAGIGDTVLIPKIRSSRIFIDASESGLLKLKAGAVSDAVIVAMMERASVNGYISTTGNFDRVELPSGTELKILTVENISGRKVTEGQSLTLRVAEDLKIGETILIAKNTPVLAIVSKAKKPGMVGRGGQLSVVLESTTSVDGQTVKLRAAKSGRGGDNFGTAFTLSYIMGIGLLIPGKNAEIKGGTIFSAYTDEMKFIGATSR